MSQDTQLAEFLAQVRGFEARKPDEQQSLFESPLQLTPEQEQGLVDHILDRKRIIEEDLGRDVTSDPDWFQNIEETDRDASGGIRAEATFFGKRQLYDMFYRNEAEWRKYLYGGIFQEHNFVVPLSHRVVKQSHSRASNYLFGTLPFYSLNAHPEGDDPDKERINVAERYAHAKFNSRILPKFRAAVENAFIRGEQVIKTTYTKDVDYYRAFANVAVTPAGEPWVANDGDYIYEDDLWVEAEIPEDGAEPVIVLKRDMQTERPPGDLVFQRQLVSKAKVRYVGADFDTIHFMNFLIPRNAESVDKADIVIHLYDTGGLELAQDLIEQARERGDPTAVKRIIGYLNDAAADDNRPKADSSYRPEIDGEGASTDAADLPKSDAAIEIAECYLRFDANRDGNPEQITAWVDVRRQRLIYADYTANVTPEGLRPFSVIRINPIDGRWHGMGAMELFDQIQQFADLFFNRWNRAKGDSGRITAFSPDACYEGDQDPNLELGWGETYHLKQNKKIEDLVGVAYLDDTNGDSWHEFLQFILQLGTNMSGVSNANDAQMAGLDTSRLATGILALQSSGEELFAPYLHHLSEGISHALETLLKTEFANIEEPEEFGYLDGADGRRKRAMLDPSLVRDWRFDLDLLLTPFKWEGVVAKTTAVIDKVNQFYALPPEIQQIQYPNFRDLLMAFGCAAPDAQLRPGAHYIPELAALPPSMSTTPQGATVQPSIPRPPSQ